MDVDYVVIAGAQPSTIVIHRIETKTTWRKVGKRDMVAYPDPEVVVPTWLFAGFIGLVTGMIVGPAIMSTTKAGSERLAELSRRYIAGK